MKNTISKAAYTGLGHCSVCGQWTKLEMWDDGLNGRFCSECFDHVVDAGEVLASQGLEAKQPVNSSKLGLEQERRIPMILRTSRKTIYYPVSRTRETELVRDSG